jgi:hypothetical protein
MPEVLKEARVNKSGAQRKAPDEVGDARGKVSVPVTKDGSARVLTGRAFWVIRS